MTARLPAKGLDLEKTPVSSVITLREVMDEGSANVRGDVLSRIRPDTIEPMGFSVLSDRQTLGQSHCPFGTSSLYVVLPTPSGGTGIR